MVALCATLSLTGMILSILGTILQETPECRIGQDTTTRYMLTKSMINPIMMGFSSLVVRSGMQRPKQFSCDNLVFTSILVFKEVLLVTVVHLVILIMKCHRTKQQKFWPTTRTLVLIAGFPSII